MPLNPLIPLIQWLNIFSSMMSVIRQPSGCSLAATLTGIIALDDQEGDCYLTMQGFNRTVSSRWCSTVDHCPPLTEHSREGHERKAGSHIQ